MPNLLDFLAAPFRSTPKEVKPPPTQKVGVTGTAVFGGYVQRPDRDPRLLGQQRYTTFSDMVANISIVAAGVRYFLNLVAKPEWTAEPANETPAAVEAAAFVQDVLADMETSWHRVVRRASMYKFYGFGVQEWTAKLRDDGRIGFLDVEPRAQKTIEQWDVDPHGDVFGCIQRAPESGESIYLPRGKLLYMVDDSIDDGPEGLGLFRHCVDPAARLKRVCELEMIGFETDLRGIPIGRAPLAAIDRMVQAGKMSKEDQNKLLSPIRSVVENHVRTTDFGLLLDSATYQSQDESATPSAIQQWSLDLLKGDSTSLPDANTAISRLTGEIARILGVDWLLLGTDGKGSLALARDKSQQFGLIVDSAIKEIREQVVRDLIDPLWRMNGLPDELQPTLKVAQIQYRDIEQVTGSLVDLAQAGAMVMPDDPVVNSVRDLLGLPEVPSENMARDAALVGRTENEPPEGEELPPETDPDRPTPPDRNDIPPRGKSEEGSET